MLQRRRPAKDHARELLETLKGVRGALQRFPQARTRRRLEGSVRLHLGCGDNVLSGWSNIDLVGSRKVIAHDLTRELPVESGTIECIYTEHFIEHITRDEAVSLLKECYRLLRAGGVIRLSTPDLRKIFVEYDAGRTSEWTDVDWKPATPCQMVNEGMREWGHKFLYDPEELSLALQEAGFDQVVAAGWRQSEHPRLRGLECRPHHAEVILEATK